MEDRSNASALKAEKVRQSSECHHKLKQTNKNSQKEIEFFQAQIYKGLYYIILLT